MTVMVFISEAGHVLELVFITAFLYYSFTLLQ